MINTTTVHKCDHCGEADTVVNPLRPKHDDFFDVTFGVEGQPDLRHPCGLGGQLFPMAKAYWCRACCIRFGLLVPIPKDCGGVTYDHPQISRIAKMLTESPDAP